MGFTVAYTGALAAMAGSNIYQGVEAHNAAKRARRDREQTQAAARNQALAASQKSREALNAAAARQPDPESLLSAATSAAAKPSPAPLLGGPSDASLSLLQLGRLKLLGE